MLDVRSRRISNELFVSAVGGNLGIVEPWVLDRLTSLLEEEVASAGDPIFAAGEPPDHFYFFRQGRVELVHEGGRSEMLEGPRAFGLLEALVDRQRNRSAFARTPLQLLRIPVEAWFSLLEDSFDLARMSVVGLVRSVAALEARLFACGRPPSPPAPFALESDSPLDLLERLAILMHTTPLGGSGVQPLSDLATASEELSFSVGERLVERGVAHERVLLLVEGRVEADRETRGPCWPHVPGQLVCGMAALGQLDTRWEARALTRARVLSFGVDDWFDVMEENFDMVRSSLAALARERDRLMDAL